MTTLLLLVCVCSVAAGVKVEEAMRPCSEPEVSEGTVVIQLSEGRVVAVDDGIRKQLLLCISGKWSVAKLDQPYVPAYETRNGKPARENLPKSRSVKSDRRKRSPNTGKFSDIRRGVNVQRKIQKGLLETTIEENTLSTVRVSPGATAYLLCRVQNLGTHSVTWTRLKDNHVLAIDTHQISSDRRLSPSYEEQTGTWILRISRVRSYDTGQYECQVSTRPLLKKVVTLQVVPAGQALGPPVAEGEKGLDYVLQNLTSIWEELAYLRHEVDGHFHDGHEGRYHHKMMDEAATMNHERHVHHLHHPHESHNNHHDNDLLQHLAHHGLGKLHYPSQGDQQAEDDGDDGEDQSSEDDDSAETHQAQGHVHAGDAHDVHGLHSLGDYDLDAFNFQDLTAESSPHAHVFIHEQGFGQGSGHSHSHGYGSSHSHGHGLGHSHDHSHGSGYSHVHEAGVPHVHEAGVPHDHSHEPVPETQRQESPGSPKQVAPGRGLALIPGRESASTGPPVPEDPWMYAKCDLQPNVDVPESTVRGSIVISQLRSGKGPVYFDLKLSGFDVASTGRIHGFHVHERAVTDGSCGSTGGHFNPHGQTHGAQDASVRHVGDLGNIEVDENGNLDGHIVTDRLVAFSGPNNIISKAIVVHAGEDDLGLGGDSGSLATGNAGGRLACCNIHIKVVPYFRFKG